MIWNSTFKEALNAAGLMPRCYLCGDACQAHWALCEYCHNALPALLVCCPICALPLSHQSSPCGDCLKNPKPYHASYCALHYEHDVGQLMHGFKHKSAWAIGDLLCAYWLNQHQNLVTNLCAQSNTLVVPVPSHISKTLTRGYNPASYLAWQLAKKLQLPYQPLLHSHPHSAQKSLNRAQRLRNLTGVFFVEPPQKMQCKGQHIVLVDDVVTSCATAIAASDALLKAGALRVSVLAIARTPKPH